MYFFPFSSMMRMRNLLKWYLVFLYRLHLLVLDTWLYEHPYCTDRDIVLFLFPLTNVLIVSRFG